MCDKTATSIAQCQLKVFYWHGVLHSIIPDQGREFVNQVKIGVSDNANINGTQLGRWRYELYSFDVIFYFFREKLR